MRDAQRKPVLPAESDAVHTHRDAFEEDLSLWNSSANINEAHGSSWIFHDSTTMCIYEPETISVVRANAPTLSALAVFDVIYSYWEVRTPQNAKVETSSERLASYHRALRCKILGALLRSEIPRKELDIVLQPWLIRTLCLYSHDLPSREAFNTIQRPSYLTEDGQLTT